MGEVTLDPLVMNLPTTKVEMLMCASLVVVLVVDTSDRAQAEGRMRFTKYLGRMRGC